MRIRTLISCLVFAMVSVTPSCLTAHLWSSYEADWIHIGRTHEERRSENLGMLFGSANVLAESGPVLSWIFTERAGDPARRLDLVPADRAAACVPIILESPGITILRSGLETDITSDEDGVHRSTTLEIEYCLAPGAFGRLLSPEMLAPHCLDSLQAIEPQSLVSARDWPSNLGLMMARCVGLSDAWRLDAWLITDESLVPVHARLPISPEESETHVVGRFRSEQGIQFGVIPSSVAALLASSNVQSRCDGICRHASRWQAVADARQNHAREHQVLGPIVERVKNISVWKRVQVNLDAAFFARLLATPVTLACDIVLGPGTLRLWHALSGDHAPDRPVDPSGTNSRAGGLR